jgi:hypothetical protein
MVVMPEVVKFIEFEGIHLQRMESLGTETKFPGRVAKVTFLCFS